MIKSTYYMSLTSHKLSADYSNRRKEEFNARQIDFTNSIKRSTDQFYMNALVNTLGMM